MADPTLPTLCEEADLPLHVDELEPAEEVLAPLSLEFATRTVSFTFTFTPLV